MEEPRALEIPWCGTKAGVGVCLTTCLRWGPWAVQRQSLLHAFRWWAESRKGVVTSHNEVIQKTLLPLTAVVFFVPLMIGSKKRGENAAVLQSKQLHKNQSHKLLFHTAGQLLTLDAFTTKGEELWTAAAQYVVMLKCYVTALITTPCKAKWMEEAGFSKPKKDFQRYTELHVGLT